MKKITLFLALLFLIAPLAHAQEDSTASYPDVTFRLLDAWLEAQIDYGNEPAIMAAALDDQKVVWSGAYGHSDMEEEMEATPNTLCSICSISKLFTSVAIMKLYDEGKLRLDDPLQQHLPWYDLEQRYELSAQVTLRSMLTHSSGLPRENAFSHWNGPDFPFPTEEEIREALSDQQTLYPSETYFQYSNLAMTLLGEVVEEVSGMEYEEYVQKEILDNLDLEDTRPYMPEDLHGQQLAIGYSPVTRQKTREPLNFFEAKGVNSAAGFSSNVLDLLDFAAWQFRLYEAEDAEILKPSTLKNMHNIHWMDTDFGTTWGLGFSVRKWLGDERWVGHGGYCPGYQSTLQLNPQKKVAYSVMINANGVNPNAYVKGIHELMEMTKGKEVPEDADHSEYRGFYSMDILGEFYVDQVGEHLIRMGLPADDPKNAITKFKKVDDDLFRRVRDNGELGEHLIFERNADGEIVSAKVFSNYVYDKVN